MREKYEAMGNEMIRNLGFENKKVILFWKAFEEERWLACELHYGCFKKGLTKQSTLGTIIIVNEREVNKMALINEKITEIWSSCNEPSLYYNKVWTWFQNGDLSSEMWDIFVMACLKSLIKKNKNVLDRLKNC